MIEVDGYWLGVAHWRRIAATPPIPPKPFRPGVRALPRGCRGTTRGQGRRCVSFLRLHIAPVIPCAATYLVQGLIDRADTNWLSPDRFGAGSVQSVRCTADRRHRIW